jgi:hypothetical protein
MDYVAWNDAIANRFFGSGFDARKVFLYVTEPVLTEIGGGTTTAKEDFLDAINVGPPWVYGDNVCQRALRCHANWRKRRPQWPPYIGYLAFFVLAAGLDGDFAPNAYYPRLRKLLGEPIESGTYPGFPEMRRLWEDLEVWSIRENQGKLGSFEVYVPGRLVHVGIPISQVILSEHERQALPELFDEAGLDSVSAPSEAFIRHCLLRHGAGRLRNRTLLALEAGSGKAEESELIISVVLQELKQWNGTFAEENFRELGKRGAIRVCLTEVDEIAGIVAARILCSLQDDYPEGGLDLSDGAESYHCDEFGEGWSTPITSLDAGDEIDAGNLDWSKALQLFDKSNQLYFKMHACHVRLFVSAQSLGMPGFVEAQSLPRKDKVFIIANYTAVPDIEEWGRRYCESFSCIPVSCGIPPEWSMFAIEGIRDDSWIREKYSQLAFSRTTQILLSGGIRDLRQSYFPFGMPTVTVVGAPDSAILHLNGVALGPANREGFLIDGSQFDSLEIRLEVKDEGSVLRQRTIYVRATEKSVGSAICWIDKTGVETTATAKDRVAGSQVVSEHIILFSDWIDRSAVVSISFPEPISIGVTKPQGLSHDVSFEEALRLLGNWKQEINDSVKTEFRSELAKLPGGDHLSEGAWRYKAAVATNNQRQFARAISELQIAMASEVPLIRVAAFVILQLAFKRTDRDLLPAPELPGYSQALLKNMKPEETGEQKLSPEHQLSISDISPLTEDGCTEIFAPGYAIQWRTS